MLYALLRSVAGVALRWFYRRIDVEGLERLPAREPVLLVVNHPNALVDALLVGWSIPRRVTLTAKATLFKHQALAKFLAWLGVVPLVRANDVRADDATSTADPKRNARAFDALRVVLRRGGAVVIFPEGISHDHPALAPLRTGAARIALEARDEGDVRNLKIVPIGLTFERKDAPRTRVVVQVGDPISLDEWHADGDAPVIALTHEIESRLRAVTLNYASSDEAGRAAALSAVFAALLTEDIPPLGSTRSYALEVSLARRISEARRALLRTTDEHMRLRADRLLDALVVFQSRLARHGVRLADVRVSTARRHALRFLWREASLIAIAGPVAFWGELNHWLPFHAARAIALRNVESASDPAMRTILAGTSLVVALYAAQGALLGWFIGWIPALLYVISLPIAADVNFLMRERLHSAVRRARAYLLVRRRPKLQASLQDELQRLRTEALEIERELSATRATEASA